jgi:hypothetical protein
VVSYHRLENIVEEEELILTVHLSQVRVKQEKEVILTRESYLDSIEHYKELELDDISQDEAKKENRATLISQHSEVSKSSLASKIDKIVKRELK